MEEERVIYNKFLLLFQELWMETPLYYFNEGLSLRFELKDSFQNSDKDAVAFLSAVLFDVINNEDLYIAEVIDADYHFDEEWLKILNRNYTYGFTHDFVSKLDPDFYEPKQKVRVFLIKNEFTKLIKLLEKIYKEKVNTQIFFINLKNKRIMNIYDDRGFDVSSTDKFFLKKLYDKYSNYILEYNRNEILINLPAKLP